MTFNALTVLILFVGFTLWLTVKLRTSAHRREKSIADWREAEREANSARRRDIDPALFFTVDFTALPPMDADSKAAARASVTMLRFPAPLSNTELKMRYGPGQLEDIVRYEENYQAFIRALLEWAEALLKQERPEDAARVLEYTVRMGSEYRKSYTLAADVYKALRDTDKLAALRDAAERHPFQDASIKKSVLTYLAAPPATPDPASPL